MSKNNFRYRKISEKEKEEIKEQAKHLLEKFGAKLETIKTPEKKFEQEQKLRQESNGWKTDNQFKDIFLLNAPFVDDDFIIAEKGGWK